MIGALVPAGQLSNQRKNQMWRRVQSIDRAMVGCVVQVRLDRDLLAGLVSGFATAMGVIEVVKDEAPRFSIALLICKAANGSGNHAVNHRLVVVRIGPPRTRSIPGDSSRIVNPGDSAGNNAARNS